MRVFKKYFYVASVLKMHVGEGFGVGGLLLLCLAARLEASSFHNVDQRRRQLRPTPDTLNHPGIVELSVGSTNYHLIRCRNYASAYSAAWLSPAEFVVKTSYKDRETLEWHSHNLYLNQKGGAYKLEEHHS